MASPSGTLYTGVTNSLSARTLQHKEGNTDSFSKRYDCNKLVYYEQHQYINNAIAREKEIKGWRREKKETLIRTMNPSWKDFYDELGQ